MVTCQNVSKLSCPHFLWQGNPCVLPASADGELSFGYYLRHEPWHDHYRGQAAEASSKGHYMAAPGTRDLKRGVAALQEQVLVLKAVHEGLPGQKKLYPAVAGVLDHALSKALGRGPRFCKHVLEPPVVNRQTVIRVHEREVPDLGALVEVRNSGTGYLQERLRQ